MQRRASNELRKFRAQSRVAEELLALSSRPNFKRTPFGLADLTTDSGLTKLQIIVDNCACLPAHVYTTSTDQVGSRHEQSNMSTEKVVITKNVQDPLMEGLRLQLSGYCLISIIRNGGLLLHGDPKAGLVQVGEKKFAFSTDGELNEFVKAPKDSLIALEMMAIMMPQLVNILGLQREPQFSHLAIPNILELVNKQQLRHEFSTQTAAHIQPEHQFDEETLFKRALQLANKRTHSTQTVFSHLHRDSYSQVCLPRDKSTQSLFGKGTTMPKKLKYFENLRGPPYFKFNVVDIVLDV